MKKKKQKPLICFDMDNTFLNSDKAHVYAYNKTLDVLGYEKHKQKYIESLFGRPHEEVAMMLLPKNEKYNYPLVSKISRLHDKFIKNYKKYVKSLLYSKEVLEKVKKKYDIGILSNCSKKVMKILLQAADFDLGMFRVIIGANEVKCSKPCPAELIKAEKITKEKPKFMIGDSVYDIMAAKKAKIKSIGVLTGHYTKKQLENAGAWKIIKDLRGLLPILKVK